jgi:hypothetical protein
MNNLDSVRPTASLLEDNLRTRAKALNLFGLSERLS